MTQPRYTLHYFDVRGRAEPIRLLLAHAGADWEDRSFAPQDWPRVKATMPLGQVPVLVERTAEGEVARPQSMAVLRHLARAHDAAGRTEAERLAADTVAETALDLAQALSRLRFSPAWASAEEKERYARDTLPLHLGRLATVLGSGPFAAGEGVTYADLLAFDVLDTHASHWPGCLEGHATLAAWVERVRALPSLAAYLPKRRPA